MMDRNTRTYCRPLYFLCIFLLLTSCAPIEHWYYNELINDFEWNEIEKSIAKTLASTGDPSANGGLVLRYCSASFDEECEIWARTSSKGGDPHGMLFLGKHLISIENYSEAMYWLSISNKYELLYFSGDEQIKQLAESAVNLRKRQIAEMIEVISSNLSTDEITEISNTVTVDSILYRSKWDEYCSTHASNTECGMRIP